MPALSSRPICEIPRRPARFDRVGSRTRHALHSSSGERRILGLRDNRSGPERLANPPVFLQKPESDANFEKLTRVLLENEAIVTPAFGSHNVRSIAHAQAVADELGIDRSRFEFQLLYGMAGPIKRALVEMGYRVREYCPVGELLPGMSYLVRRLLENTSNEGFLRAKFSENVPAKELLRDPRELIKPAVAEPACPPKPRRRRAIPTGSVNRITKMALHLTQQLAIVSETHRL